MKKTLLLLSLFISFLTFAQTLQSDLETVFEDYQLMGMSVWTEVNGVEEEYHFGLRDFDRTLEINDQTHYRIASVSKSFTALGIMKLYDEELFNLDDDISSYLGYQVRNPAFPAVPITFRMLLSHTASLQDGSGYSPFLNATYSQLPIPNISEVLLPGGSFYTANMWRTESPGTFFMYSNLNYGLLGTLVEAISGQRFDVYMKNEILIPLGIVGSFNVQDLQNINDVAVLYRNIGGWQAQYDNYQGVMPPPPNMGNYVPGTNGAYFAPQGGLRISAADAGKIAIFIAEDGANSNLDISLATLQEMKSIQWDYNGSNGDNYFGLFNRWGLGLHHANVGSGDQICNLGNYGTFMGHPGEAYGLISDVYFLLEEEVSFSLLINGIWNGYQPGNNSSFYTVEEDVFAALCTYFEQALSVKQNTFSNIILNPNPTSGYLEVLMNKNTSTFKYIINDMQGRELFAEQKVDTSTFTIDLSSLVAGVYFIVFTEGDNRIVKKIIKE